MSGVFPALNGPVSALTGALRALQPARDVGRVLAVSRKRPAVQAATRHLNLRNASVCAYLNRFSAALARLLRLVGLLMIKYVPLPAHAHKRAVVVSPIILRRPVSVQPYVAVRNYHAAELKIPVGPVAYGIGQLVAVDGGVHKIIPVPNLAQRRGLVKFISFKARARAVLVARYAHSGRAFKGKHIAFQLHHLPAVRAHVFQTLEFQPQPYRKFGRKTRIQVGLPVVVGKYPGVKTHIVALFASVKRAVGVFYLAVRLERPVGRVALRHANSIFEPEAEIKVIHSVGAARAVGRPHTLVPRFVPYVFPGQGNALYRPVRKVRKGSRPHCIVAGAKPFTVRQVAAAVNIHPVAENVRLAIGYILSFGQVGVKSLSFHHLRLTKF